MTRLPPHTSDDPIGSAALEGETRYAALRDVMVRDHIEARGVTSPLVLSAMRSVPRHRLVPPDAVSYAYDDGPLSIGEGQTISQPYVVAWMSQLAGVGPGSRVLEIGTGSGYQAAVLATMGVEVFTIEIVEALGRRAREALSELDLTFERGGRVHTRIGDGHAGWPEEAPFDAILLTAAPEALPEVLLDQLRVGGVLVAPVGPRFENQELMVVRRTEAGFEHRNEGLVRFVPMTGGGRDR